MKIGGKSPNGPKIIELYIPRTDDVILFKFVGVTDDSEFHKLYPEPSPPKTMKVGIGIVENVEDANFKEQLLKREIAKKDWFFLKSVSPSNIEWDTVKLDDFETWGNWKIDLKNAGFSVPEVNTIYAKFWEANTLSEDMLAEARQRFLASQQEVQLAKP
jgi:hypothetical protein